MIQPSNFHFTVYISQFIITSVKLYNKTVQQDMIQRPQNVDPWTNLLHISFELLRFLLWCTSQ